MIKVCLDAGHYGKYNRSPVYPSYYESDMSWKLHNYLANELEAYDIEVIKTRANQDTDRELVSRGLASKGCNLFLSLHSNAAGNENANYAIAIHLAQKSGANYDDKAEEIALKLADVIGKTMGCEGRTGTRAADWDRDGNGRYDDEYYGVLQGAKLAQVPGIILEHGFHTNAAQAKWLSVDANLKKLAAAEAAVIAKYFGCSKKDAAPSTLYRVRVGSYVLKRSAQKTLQKLQKAGFSAAIVKIGSSYKCQVGSYTVKANATTMQKKLISYGFTSAKVVVNHVYKVCNCDFLNLRKSPNGKIKKQLKEGERVMHGSTSKTVNGVVWLKITTTDGVVGYASANYLKKL